MRPRISLRPGLAAALVAGAIGLAACGGDDEAGGPDPAQLTPADVPIFVDVVVRPEGDLAAGASSALEQLTGGTDPGGFVVEQIDDLLAQQDTGVSYEADIQQWLGQRAGAFVTEVGSDGQADFALMFAVTDESAAQETVDKLNDTGNAPRTDETYEGVDYSLNGEDSAVGFIDEFLVIGSSEATFQSAVDASSGDNLTASETYSELSDLANSERLVSVYVDTPMLVDELDAAGALSREDVDPVLDQLGAAGEVAVLASASLSADEVSFELAGTAAEGDAQLGSALLEQLPADSWLALAGADVGGAISAAVSGLGGGAGLGLGAEDVTGALESELGLNLAQDFGWLGDAAAFVTGSSVLSIGAGIVAETTDSALSAAALQRLGDSLARGGNVDIGPTEGGVGFRIGVPDVPLGAEVVQEGDQVIAAGGSTSVEDLLNPTSGGLTGSETFQRAQSALGDDFDVGAFLNFVDLLDLIEEIPQIADDPDFQTARGVLDGLDFLVFGSRQDGEVSVLGAVLGLADGGGSGTDGDSSEAAATLSP
jgi:hypothetical protein